jgi:Holliday junction resolvase RusA-like endonuclease
MVDFIVHGDPVPQPRARISTAGGFARAYVPAKHPVHTYRQTVAQAAIEAGATITHGPVSVMILATWKRPKSHMTKKGVKPDAPMLPRADVDNVAKAVLDALTGIAWNDDQQVQGLMVWKEYGAEAMTFVAVGSAKKPIKQG